MKTQSSSLDEAILRSKLSSSNKMEMLAFRLTDDQLYGINVFKIIEILECPKHINKIPQSHPAVKGVVPFRGQAITVIDLSEAVEMASLDYQRELGYLVVCEYNRQLNAFLVKSTDSLLTRGWDEIKRPEAFQAPSIVAIAYADDEEMIQILDIEGILTAVVGMNDDVSPKLLDDVSLHCAGKKVLLVDDSSSAMTLMKQTMDSLGIVNKNFNSAVKALQYLEAQVENPQESDFDLIVSDIEMPGMDGFTFTRNVRQMPKFSNIPIALHSSMSNPTNQQKAQEAGANEFIAKFDPLALGNMVMRLMA